MVRDFTCSSAVLDTASDCEPGQGQDNGLSAALAPLRFR